MKKFLIVLTFLSCLFGLNAADFQKRYVKDVAPTLLEENAEFIGCYFLTSQSDMRVLTLVGVEHCYKANNEDYTYLTKYENGTFLLQIYDDTDTGVRLIFRDRNE